MVRRSEGTGFHAPDHLLASNIGQFQPTEIGGIECRVLTVRDFEIVYVQPGRQNVILVARKDVINGDFLRSALNVAVVRDEKR